MTAALAILGHNNPPEPTPYELSVQEIEALYEQAGHWLDGAGVNSEAEAGAIAKLIESLRGAINTADERRKAEKKIHDEAVKEIQSRYNRLIGETSTTKGLAVRALQACKDTLAPWLRQKDEEQRAEAERLRQEADAQRAAAQELVRSTNLYDLAGREIAEAELQAAGEAEKAAERATRTKAQASGGSRAIGLRKTFRAEITDEREFARWAWQNCSADLSEFLQQLAAKLVARGQRSGIPGVTIHEVSKV